MGHLGDRPWHKPPSAPRIMVTAKGWPFLQDRTVTCPQDWPGARMSSSGRDIVNLRRGLR